MKSLSQCSFLPHRLPSEEGDNFSDIFDTSASTMLTDNKKNQIRKVKVIFYQGTVQPSE